MITMRLGCSFAERRESDPAKSRERRKQRFMGTSVAGNDLSGNAQSGSRKFERGWVSDGPIGRHR
jgi:hypothetical protein